VLLHRVRGWCRMVACSHVPLLDEQANIKLAQELDTSWQLSNTFTSSASITNLFIASTPLKQQPWAAFRPIRPTQLSIWQCAFPEVLLLFHFSFQVLPQGVLPHHLEIRALILQYPQIQTPSEEQLSERRRFPNVSSTQRAVILNP
jgi:hypothetical protein